MRNEHIDYIVDRYEDRLHKYGYDIRTMASGTEERRNIRYRVLSEVGDLNGCSVLDLGCGFADFHDFMVRTGTRNMNYVGYDIVPGIIDMARARHPDLEFRLCDVFSEEFPVFDYIVSSSAFNLNLDGDNYAIIDDLLKILYAHARKGVAIDFMSSYVDFRGSDEVFHYEPEKVFALAKKSSKRVCLRHDYELYEFCIYIYKDFTGWSSGA